MKKNLLILSLLLLLFSCSKPSYKIVGTISGASDGDSILLGYSVDGSQLTPKDYAIVKNGEFTFTGSIDKSKIFYLGYEKGESPIYTLFFLEPGTMNVNLSIEESEVKGTADNDLFLEIQNSLASKIVKMQELQSTLFTDSTITDSKKEEIEKEITEIQNEAVTYVQGKIRDNINSMVGLFMLVQYTDFFENDELVQLIEVIPQENRDSSNNCLYNVLIEIQQQRNSPQDASKYLESLGIENTEELEEVIE